MARKIKLKLDYNRFVELSLTEADALSKMLDGKQVLSLNHDTKRDWNTPVYVVQDELHVCDLSMMEPNAVFLTEVELKAEIDAEIEAIAEGEANEG